jgi:hypothetical protein
MFATRRSCFTFLLVVFSLLTLPGFADSSKTGKLKIHSAPSKPTSSSMAQGIPADKDPGSGRRVSCRRESKATECSAGLDDAACNKGILFASEPASRP